MKKDTEIQIKVLEKIIGSTDVEINDYRFMLNCIFEYGIYPFSKTMDMFPKGRYTENGVMQVPSEFAAFCNFISGFNIENALELGVYRGRSSYIMCAILYRKNKELKYYMLDIKDQLDDFEIFSSMLPIIKCIPGTSEMVKKNKYDFVFIDADHSYEGSMGDFINVGQYTRQLICFHDIFAHEYDKYNGGTVRTWKEIGIVKDMFTTTFSQFPNQWMGIGVGIKNNYDTEPAKDFEEVLQYNKSELEEFHKFMGKFNHIYFYGTGGYAGILYAYILKSGQSGIIKGLIISDHQKESQDMIFGYRVYHLNELQEQDDQCGFVLALPECHHKEVALNLSAGGYHNIFAETVSSFVYPQKLI